MGKGSSPGPLPKAPNPRRLIKAQGAENRSTAELNQKLSSTDQSTPFGTLKYTQLPDGRWQATTEFTPDQQRLLDTYTGYATTSAENADKWAQGIQEMNPEFNFTGANLGQYILDQYKPQYEEEYQRARNARTVELANKGIREGSDAFEAAMRDFDLNLGDVWSRIQRDSRTQALEEALAQRNQIFKELESIRGGVISPVNSIQPVNTPGYNQPFTDVAGITQQGFDNQMSLYNARAQQAAQEDAERSALMSGLFQIGGSILGGPIGGSLGKGVSSFFGG